MTTKPEEVDHDLLDQFVKAYAESQESKREIVRREICLRIEALGITNAVPIGNQDEYPRFRWGFMEFQFDRSTELHCWLCCMSCGERLRYARAKSKVDLGYEVIEFKKLQSCMKCNQPVYLR